MTALNFTTFCGGVFYAPMHYAGVGSLRRIWTIIDDAYTSNAIQRKQIWLLPFRTGGVIREAVPHWYREGSPEDTRGTATMTGFSADLEIIVSLLSSLNIDSLEDSRGTYLRQHLEVGELLSP